MLRPSYSFKGSTSSSRPQSAYTGAATTPVPIPAGPIQADVQQVTKQTASLSFINSDLNSDETLNNQSPINIRNQPKIAFKIPIRTWER